MDTRLPVRRRHGVDLSTSLSTLFPFLFLGMANRTTLVDNNTWNNSHIALVGKAMSSTEDKAYVIMRTLDVDYVLVIFGGMIGYSGDDINKFLWMVRIAEGEHPQDIKVKEKGDSSSQLITNVCAQFLCCVLLGIELLYSSRGVPC